MIRMDRVLRLRYLRGSIFVFLLRSLSDFKIFVSGVKLPQHKAKKKPEMRWLSSFNTYNEATGRYHCPSPVCSNSYTARTNLSRHINITHNHSAQVCEILLIRRSISLQVACDQSIKPLVFFCSI